jgi:hypothetical protein
VTAIADILLDRIAGYKRTNCSEKQKYLFHIDY